MRLGGHAIAAVQAEQVARLEHQRADLVVAAAIALQLIMDRLAAAAAEHGQVQPPAFDPQAGRLINKRVARQ